MKNRIISIIICVGLIFSFSSLAFSAESDNNVSEQLLDKNHEKMITEAVKEYFEIKEDTINDTAKSAPTISESKLIRINDNNYELFKGVEAELNSKARLEAYYGINVVNVEVTSDVRDMQFRSNVKGKNDYLAKVYEWTWVDYTSDESGVIDRMGYGIEHDMVFRVSSADAPILLENDYYDEDVVGEISPAARQDENNLEISEEIFVDDSRAVTLDQSNLNINRLIAYADNYVYHDNATSPTVGYYSYYNSNYEYFPGNDCTNYVSQCLRAGGLPDDHTAPSIWWHDGTSSTDSWRFVYNMISYFTGEGLTKLTIASNFSNVYPGNPVITNDNGHVAICVGYNHAGTPIINGHTRDVYHQPIRRSNTDGYYYTFKVFTSDYMVGNPGNATLIYPTSTYQSAGSVSIPAQQSRFYKIKSTGNKTLYIRFGNAISGRKMYGVLYEKQHVAQYDEMNLYQVAAFTTTGLQEYTTSITGSSSSPKEYYLRFYHYWTSPQTLNFFYKVS